MPNPTGGLEYNVFSTNVLQSPQTDLRKSINPSAIIYNDPLKGGTHSNMYTILGINTLLMSMSLACTCRGWLSKWVTKG